MVIPLKANEVVIKAGDSFYLSEQDKIGGKMILTNQRIYFRSANGHGDNHNLEILPSEISEVIFFNTRRILPNGLNLILKNGEEKKFSIKKRNEFGSMINKMY